MSDETKDGLELSDMWVWYSWHVKRKVWVRSCWYGNTEEEARRWIDHPMAQEMRDYRNALVHERRSSTIIEITEPIPAT